jgi:hypothetical protein
METKCYDVRIMPVIESIDLHAGYSTGGQEITITGKSLNATNPVVKIGS